MPDIWTLPPPNIRSMVIPDPGYLFVEADLAGADAQVVAWDANAPRLKAALRSGVDLHSANAQWLYGDGLDYRRHIHVNGMSLRDNAKRAVHAGNYGAGARTLSASISVPLATAEGFLHWWRAVEHPEIGQWHRRVDQTLRSRRMPTIRNAFGFRRIYTDLPDRLLGQALAWIAQSTVGLVINHAMLAVEAALPQLQLLAQVHDSLLWKCPLAEWPSIAPAILHACAITVPYPDPLVIPVELKYSQQSWGEMQKWTAPPSSKQSVAPSLPWTSYAA